MITEQSISEPPEKKQAVLPGPLPYKLARFQKLLIKSPGASPTDIALRVYDCKDRHSASTIAAQNLKKLGISRLDIMERAGLTDERDAADLRKLREAKKVVSAVITGNDAGAADKDFIEVDDNQTQFKALELTYKIKGAFSDEKQGQGGDIINNFLTIVDRVNIANINSPDKGLSIGRSESDQFNKYLAQ